MAIQRLSHLGLCVSELERSVEFYCDGLGFRRVSELQMAGEPLDTLLQLPDVDMRAVYLERDGFRIELIEYRTPAPVGDRRSRPMNQLGLTHLSLRVDDFDTLLASLRDRGVTVLDRSRIDIPAFGASAVFVADPDGILIELVQSPGDPSLLPGQ